MFSAFNNFNHIIFVQHIYDVKLTLDSEIYDGADKRLLW